MRVSGLSSIVLAALCILLIGFLLAPLAIILVLSFTADTYFVFPPSGWSLKWYAEVMASAEWRRSFVNSMLIATATALLATVFGTMAALGLWKLRSPLKGVIYATLLAPSMVPIVITAVALFAAFSRVGLVNTYSGIIIGHTLLALPFVILSVGAALQSYNPNLGRAAASLGGSPLRVFLGVMMPVIAPGLITGALLAFSTSFDEVVLALFLASPGQRTVPRQIYAGIGESITPAAAALVILRATILMLLIVYRSRTRT